MGVKFPSQAWADAMKEAVNSSPAYAAAAKTWAYSKNKTPMSDMVNCTQERREQWK